MPRISTCTDTILDDTNVLTKDDKYPWLDPEDKQRYPILCMTISYVGRTNESYLERNG